MKGDKSYPEFLYPAKELCVHIPAKDTILLNYRKGIEGIIEIKEVKDLLTFY